MQSIKIIHGEELQNVEMSTTNTRHYSSKYELSVEGVGKPAHER